MKRSDLANAIRALSMDAVQEANSGHPGMPMGMADIAQVLWMDFLQHNPVNPSWFNRDRFVLSNGHGCMLLYSLLHLTGYAVTVDDLKNFRKLHSKTPGHPEYGITPGVETTTGPLGQGLASAVGMALAEKVLAASFNRDGFELVDHYTYVFIGDGCLMEGISHEVCSLAGTLKLGKLIVFYDDNGISIDGKVGGWFTDDTVQRFQAYHWQVIAAVDGHDAEAVKQAIVQARSDEERPTLICCKTEIGYGAPNMAGSHKSHGSPLGEAEIKATRANLGWPHPPFVIPNEIYQAWDARAQGQVFEQAWEKLLERYQAAHPALAREFRRRIAGQLPAKLADVTQQYVQSLLAKRPKVATRQASGDFLEAVGNSLPELLGGSADLTGSNNTWWSGSEVIRPQTAAGNYIHYGVREFGMFAIMNGLALHGGFIPYGGTFLTFVDYGRNAVRLAAMMRQKVLFILTHDSIGLGEDGPTHQPIEHASMLRLTPDLQVWRPADAVETAVAWQEALQHAGPSCLLLTRQAVPHLDHLSTHNICRGGYILKDTDERAPQIILLATGSEVQLALGAQQQLAAKGYAVRVVSMPSTTVFDQQPQAYRDQVLPPGVTARVAVEAGTSAFWYKYVGLAGRVLGLDRFGESAPYQEVYQALGMTVDAVVAAAVSVVNVYELHPEI